MDLSFRPDPAAASELPAADTALLVAMLADRPGASATAQVQALIGAARQDAADPLATVGGAFNPAMAARLAAWKQA